MWSGGNMYRKLPDGTVVDMDTGTIRYSYERDGVTDYDYRRAVEACVTSISKNGSLHASTPFTHGLHSKQRYRSTHI